MANKKKISAWFWIFMVIFVIVLIITYVASLGKVNISNTSTPEFKDDKEQAKRRHEKLEKLIEKRTELKNRLTKRFKRIYFTIRIGFVAIWAAFIIILIHFGLIKNLSDAMDYSNAAILGWITLNFLTFGNLSNLNSFLSLNKIKLENWIWGKYVNINDSIEENKKELDNIKKEIAVEERIN